MATKSPRLYDVKRGMKRVYQYQDAAWAARYTFGFEGVKCIGRIFPLDHKHISFQRAKVLFEANVGYKVDNGKFKALLKTAKSQRLIK